MEGEYGITPPAPDGITSEVVCEEPAAPDGAAVHRQVTIGFETPGGPFAFRTDVVIPNRAEPVPAFVYLSYQTYPNGPMCPEAEIAGRGYAVASFRFEDVTLDREDGFTSGLAGLYPRRGDGTDWGKLGMWAYAASRVLDHLLSCPEIDPDRVYVIGHSRLGKAAVWCAVQDERFAGVVSNASGFAGAAITRRNRFEHIAKASKRFGYWLCDNIRQYADREEEMPFEQNQLLGLMAPRLLCIGSGSLDRFADPDSEYLTAVLASEAYTLLGLDGLVGYTDETIPAGQRLFDGRVGYQLREGPHDLTSADWQAYCDFFDVHRPVT